MRPQGRKNKRKGGGVPRAFAKITDAGDQIVKRITFGGSALATGAGTAIPVTAVSTAAVTGGAEWASFAARYQQYRVRAMRITGKATQPVQTAALAHSVLYRGDFIGSSTPGSVAQVLSDESVRQCATHADFTCCHLETEPERTFVEPDYSWRSHSQHLFLGGGFSIRTCADNRDYVPCVYG